jgi:membrane protein DedA with SNARE-associated domain
MSGHEIHHLLHEYGLGVVFAVVALQALGAPLPGTTVLIAAAVYASTSHGLPIAGVIGAGALGALAGTSVGFAVGRWRGEAILVSVGRRLRQSPERVQSLRREFANHGGSWLFFGRFISGVRNVTGLVAGGSAMPVTRFLPLSAAAALAWALINSLEYYWFGQALAGADTWVQVLLIVLGLAWLVFSLRLMRRRALRRLDSVAETKPGP